MKMHAWVLAGIVTAGMFLPLQNADAGHYRRHYHHPYHHGYRPHGGIGFSFNFAPQPRYVVVPPRPVYVQSRNVVADVQSALTRRGYDVGGVDGIAGPRTRAAIADFQHASGLPATGEINEATLRGLRLI
jgi:hypothetical protein